MPIPRDSKGHFVKGYINPNKGAKNLKISGKNHPMFGKHHKEESKLKMSLAKKGKKPKFIPDNKGRKISKEQIEFLRKINTGKKISEETKKKISESKKKNPTRYWLGKKRPEITGEKNPK
jgi:putative cell wall-binding protein